MFLTATGPVWLPFDLWSVYYLQRKGMPLDRIKRFVRGFNGLVREKISGSPTPGENSDAIGALRAEWSELDTPLRIQALAQRHLPLKPIEISQYDKLDHLPPRPLDIVPPGTSDPIGAIIETQADAALLTGSVAPPPDPR